ncbi:MAG: FkbM family methyltransferase [Roseiarcus sp.]|jgi:FkbM family methyltransferase
MNLLSQFIWRQRTLFRRTISLGGHRITLPAGHLLDWHRLRNRRYDEPIAEIAELLLRKHRAPTMIDIGANVGDTAALMARSPEVAILCVEGNPKFLPLLRQNLATISPISEIESSYVGAGEEAVAGCMRTYDGTATLVEGSGTVSMRSLAQVLASHARFQRSRLLKIDTDGFDAKIVIAASEIISTMKPIVHVEYSPIGPDGAEQECRSMIECLKNAGYTLFHVFDNFGNHMLRLPAEQTDHLRALNAYVRSCRNDLRPSVFYYDICALTPEDKDISDELLRHYVEETPIV